MVNSSRRQPSCSCATLERRATPATKQSDHRRHDHEDGGREDVSGFRHEPDGDERGGATGNDDTEVPAHRDTGEADVLVEQQRHERVRADLGSGVRS